jgi:hypothetical protein
VPNPVSLFRPRADNPEHSARGFISEELMSDILELTKAQLSSAISAKVRRLDPRLLT